MFNELTWWHVVYLLVTTHITIVTVTVYLHRGLAHRSLSIGKPLEHFFRFWCWLTTGQNPKEWAAVHRKHHAFCEKEGDPHSPKLYGIWNILFKGVIYYKKETRNEETIKRFGHMCPDDKLSEFYSKYSKSGMTALGIFQVLLFGWHGLWILAIQLIWIPFWAAGVINGVGHYLGYRNFKTTDSSTNISPWGIIIGGEELHNNHHAYPTSAKLSFKWYEFDIGWGWIQLFQFFGLLKVNKVNKLPIIKTNQTTACIETILANKSFVLKMFYAKTKHEVLSTIENIKNGNSILNKFSNKELNYVFYHDTDSTQKLTDTQKLALTELLKNTFLAYIHKTREELIHLWTNKSATAQQIKDDISSWISSVKNNNIMCLEIFANNLTRLSS